VEAVSLRWLINFLKERVVDWTSFCYSLHFFVTAVMVIIINSFGVKPIHAVAIALMIGLLKEIYDAVVRYSGADMLDVVCNICGAFVGWLLVQ